MTTIACDGKSMAGDGLASRGDLITCKDAVKVERLADGTLVGAAGDKHECIALRKWLTEGGAKPKAKNMEALALKPNGELWHYNDSTPGVLTEAPNAIGTGCSVAIGAMDAGAVAEQAVVIASGRDIYTGGKITVLHLEPTVRAVA